MIHCSFNIYQWLSYDIQVTFTKKKKGRKWENPETSMLENRSFADFDLDLCIWIFQYVLCFASLHDIFLFSNIAMVFLSYSVNLYKNWDIKWEIPSFSTFWNWSFVVLDLDLRIWFCWSVFHFALLNDMLFFSNIAMVFLWYSVNHYINWDMK